MSGGAWLRWVFALMVGSPDGIRRKTGILIKSLIAVVFGRLILILVFIYSISNINFI